MKSKNMKRAFRPSRRLVVGLAFLLINTYSSPFTSTIGHLPGVSEYSLPASGSLIDPSVASTTAFTSRHNQAVWFATVDNQCMGPYGYSECGDANAWQMIESDHSKPNQYNLHIYLDDSLSSVDKFQSCLSVSDMKPMISNHCSNRFSQQTSWTFDASTGRLSINILDMETFHSDDYCIASHPTTSELSLQSCTKGHAKLAIVPYPVRRNHILGQIVTSRKRDYPKLETEGFWTCQKSGLSFPRNLKSLLGSSVDHVLMGGDIFMKRLFNMNFKVYTAAWYVDVEGARKDPALKAFAGKSAAELSALPSFYEAIVEPGSYDRTLFIKLAMKLKCEYMVQGLIDDLLMKDENKIAIANASRKYNSEDCDKGLELVFTWRHPQPATHFKHALEIRVGGTLIDTLDSTGDEGRDLLLQYVVPDPVAPLAKAAFAFGFPALLATPDSAGAASAADMISSGSSSAAHSGEALIPRVINSGGRILNAVAMMS